MSDAKKHLLGDTKGEKAISITAIVISAILIPILILNMVLILKNAVNPDQVPSIGKSTPLIVLTESMEPKIKSGDMIITKITAIEDIGEEDVIAFFDPASKGNSVVTHRVIGKYEEGGKIYFETQGDNNDIADKHAVPAENVIGVWHGFRLPLLGHVMLFMQSAWGLILCIALPVSLFVLLEVLQRRKKDKDSQSDIDALKAELEALKQAQAKAEQNGDGE